MAVENFGETPEEFDLDAWIEQGTRPQRTVKIFRDWVLMDEMARLEKLIEVADQEADPSMNDVSGEELREQYQAVLDKLSESAIEVTLRALTQEEYLAVADGIPDVQHTIKDHKGEEFTRWKADSIATGDALVAEATVSPKMTRGQVRKMRERLGDGPTLTLYTTTTELLKAGQVLPEVPFSAGRSDDSQG